MLMHRLIQNNFSVSIEKGHPQGCPFLYIRNAGSLFEIMPADV